MTIDKNIPIPRRICVLGETRSNQILEALKTLGPGDSTVDLIKDEQDQRLTIMIARRSGVKVVTRKLRTGGWRVWRLE
jgi:hypothetical protein